MSTAESWNLTPREFDARNRVLSEFREQEIRRWVTDRVERLNAPHFFRKDKRAWTLEDFLGGGPKVSDIQAERDRLDLARELALDKALSAKMQRKDFDDSGLPGWARMTPEEKRSRGL